MQLLTTVQYCCNIPRFSFIDNEKPFGGLEITHKVIDLKEYKRKIVSK